MIEHYIKKYDTNGMKKCGYIEVMRKERERYEITNASYRHRKKSLRVKWN